MFYVVCYFEDRCIFIEKEVDLTIVGDKINVGDTVSRSFKTRTLDDSGMDSVVDIIYDAVILFKSVDRSRIQSFKKKVEKHSVNIGKEVDFFKDITKFGQEQFEIENSTKRGASSGVRKVLNELNASQPQIQPGTEHTKKRQRPSSEEKDKPTKMAKLKTSKPGKKLPSSEVGAKPAKKQLAFGGQSKNKKQLDTIMTIARNIEVETLEEEMGGAFWLGEQSEPTRTPTPTPTPTPIKHARTLRQHPPTSTQHSGSTPQHTHMQQTPTPKKHTRTPTQQTPTPKKHTRTPTQQTPTPKKDTRTPTQQTPTPKKHTRSPKKHTRTPTQQTPTFTQQSSTLTQHTHIQQTHTPTQHTPTSTQYSSTPTTSPPPQHTPTPIKHARTPRQHTPTFTHHSSTLTQHTHMQQTHTPTQHTPTSTQYSSTPTTSTPPQHTPTPIKHVRTPRQHTPTFTQHSSTLTQHTHMQQTHTPMQHTPTSTQYSSTPSTSTLMQRTHTLPTPIPSTSTPMQHTTGYYGSLLDSPDRTSCCGHCSSMRFEIQYLQQVVQTQEREIQEIKNSMNSRSVVSVPDAARTVQDNSNLQLVSLDEPDDEPVDTVEILHNGYLPEQLENVAKRKKSVGKATAVLFRKLFSKEEVVGRSATGAKGTPPIDSTKRMALVGTLLKCFPASSEAEINRKLADLLKPSRK